MTGFRRKVLFFALACVGVSSAFLLWLAHHLVDILASPTWCGRAIGAVERSSEATDGYKQCTGLLITQVKALAVNSHIALGTIALSLLVLVVIVLAQGRLSGKGPGGIEVDIGASEAAREVADAAEHRADEIEGEAR